MKIGERIPEMEAEAYHKDEITKVKLPLKKWHQLLRQLLKKSWKNQPQRR